MDKKSIVLDDETSHLIDYYLSHNDSDLNKLANQAFKFYITNHLSGKELQQALEHKGKDSFPTDEVLRSFKNWSEN